MEHNEILSAIAQEADFELSQIVQSVISRYNSLFPGEEIVFLSLPTDDPAERRRILEQVA